MIRLWLSYPQMPPLSHPSKCHPFIPLPHFAPPSGRGYGFSYTNDAGRRNKDEEKGPKVAEMGSITGSDNDLRRLSIEACVSILLKFGVEQSVVDANMSRWWWGGRMRG